MSKYSFCFGIRLTSNFQEVSCAHRESCAFYRNVSLAHALAHPESFEEADTYNDKQCNLWQQDNQR